MVSDLKQSKRSNFKNSSIIDNNFTASHIYMTKVKFHKPVYIGFSVLVLSKLLLWGFRYDKFKNYDPYLNLGYVHTDS